MVAKHLEAQAAHKDSRNDDGNKGLTAAPVSVKPLVTPKVTK